MRELTIQEKEQLLAFLHGPVFPLLKEFFLEESKRIDLFEPLSDNGSILEREKRIGELGCLTDMADSIKHFILTNTKSEDNDER